MTQLDVLALIVVGIMAMVIMGIMAHEIRPSKKYETKKPKGFPEPPEPMAAPPKPEIVRLKVNTEEEYHCEESPLIIDGLPHKMVCKTESFNNRSKSVCSFEINEDHEMTKEFRRLEKLKSLAMFGVIDGVGTCCSHKIGVYGLITDKGTCARCQKYIKGNTDL